MPAFVALVTSVRDLNTALSPVSLRYGKGQALYSMAKMMIGHRRFIDIKRESVNGCRAPIGHIIACSLI
ncbi:uncharacterized protein METZ01_LOCUS377044 [marine metagenome]|jgi:hypothetical protein|uniref:Uncharacterized protein n=1 Tax=marine metagenome TaxID=408172 RepID=A0A382TQ74_9ZZZZ